jgi:hypothetical protein
MFAFPLPFTRGVCYNNPKLMRDFVDTLPLRLAAVVAALVGVVCLYEQIDVWVAAWRIGIAFMALLLAGLGVRWLILSLSDDATKNHGAQDPQTEGMDDASSDASAAPTSGKNVDVIVPGTSIGDLLGDDSEDK